MTNPPPTQAEGRGRAAGLEGFSPGYFALVMATGILSLALRDCGLRFLPLGLLWLNAAAYGVLWALSLLRFARWRAAFVYDLTHHSRGAQFLTTAAATSVLGCQFFELTECAWLAEALWFLAVVLGLALSYGFVVVITVREPKPPLEAGISGAWLLVVVASESIGVLGTMVAQPLARGPAVLFVSLLAYLVGAMLYVFFITLILYRWTFFRLPPEKFTPDYWIDMGAVAITTLAGTQLIHACGQWRLLHTLEPFLIGFTLLFWATGTWWIPLLLIVECWRHLVGRVRFTYSPGYWSLIFPLGTYSAATFALAGVIGLPGLRVVAYVFAGGAFIAWILAFTGMVRSLVFLGLRAAGPGSRSIRR